MLGKVSLVLCAESSINFRLLQERRFWLQAHHTAITIFLHSSLVLSEIVEIRAMLRSENGA